MLCGGSARTLTGSYSASSHPTAGFNYPLRNGSEGTDREGRGGEGWERQKEEQEKEERLDFASPLQKFLRALLSTYLANAV